MGVSYIADKFARSQTSEGAQYFGLGLFVVAEAIIFVPILYIADGFFSGAISTADDHRLACHRFDFNGFHNEERFFISWRFLENWFSDRSRFIVCSFFWLTVLILFSGAAMALLAAGSVLYTTSNILHHYHPGQHVAASLALFSSIALLFWYALQIVMSLMGRD